MPVPWVQAFPVPGPACLPGSPPATMRWRRRHRCRLRSPGPASTARPGCRRWTAPAPRCCNACRASTIQDNDDTEPTMEFISTRNASPPASLSQAIAAGLAPDGGLYVPAKLPAGRALEAGASLSQTTASLLAPFFEGDALAPALPAICAEALDFPVPLKPLATPGDHVLELFHGPTAAFKDVGARFLAATLA